MSMPPPPPGFELVDGSAGVPPPPPGFVMDGGAGRFAQPALAGATPPVDTMADAGGQLVRGINRSINTALSLPGEIVGGAVNLVAPGQGDRFRWNNPVSQFMASPEAPPQTDLGRYAESVGQALGASALPIAGIAAKAQQAAGPAAQTVLGGIGQQMVNAYRTAPGTAVAADVAASVGAGIGQQAAEDLGFGATGQMVGGLAGAMTPAGVASAVSAVGRNPAVASARQAIDNWRSDTARPAVPPDQMFSAGPQVPQQPPRPIMPRITTAEAAADQAIANQLARANVDMPEVRNRLMQYTDALPAGQPPAIVLADVDDSLARLAGTSARKNPEAGNIASNVLFGRQTGETPRSGMPANSGIATRPAMTPRVPGSPMGQNERVREGLREVMEIPPASARQTEAALMAELETNARPLYRQAYAAAQGVDLAPTVAPLVQEWRAIAADQVNRKTGKQIREAVASVQRALQPGRTSSMERLNQAKIEIDGMITSARRSTENASPNAVRLLTDLKNQLLDAMDSVPNAGPLFSRARGMYSSNYDMQEALELGRAAFRDGSEVTAEIYRALTPGQQRMFRSGLFESAEQAIASPRKNNDVALLFESPRIQEILNDVVPNGGAARFGAFLQGEKQFVRTRNEVLGNSKTAQRQEDDKATEAVMGVVDKLRLLRRPAELGIEAITAVINRTFGFRADTHAQIARQLFTADPATQERILARLEKRLGPHRYSQFQMMMNQAYGRAAQAGTATVAPAVSQTNQQQPRQP